MQMRLIALQSQSHKQTNPNSIPFPPIWNLRPKPSPLCPSLTHTKISKSPEHVSVVYSTSRKFRIQRSTSFFSPALHTQLVRQPPVWFRHRHRWARGQVSNHSHRLAWWKTPSSPKLSFTSWNFSQTLLRNFEFLPNSASPRSTSNLQIRKPTKVTVENEVLTPRKGICSEMWHAHNGNCAQIDMKCNLR